MEKYSLLKSFVIVMGFITFCTSCTKTDSRPKTSDPAHSLELKTDRPGYRSDLCRFLFLIYSDS